MTPSSPVDPPADAHALDVAAVAAALAVDPTAGLDPEEIGDRAALAGPNELEPRKRESVLAMLVESATEPFVVLLAAAGLAAILLDEVRDGILILIGLLTIVGADVVTEYRGERALDALRDASAPMARVRRGGVPMNVAAATLVPGDVVLLRKGGGGLEGPPARQRWHPTDVSLGVIVAVFELGWIVTIIFPQ